MRAAWVAFLAVLLWPACAEAGTLSVVEAVGFAEKGARFTYDRVVYADDGPSANDLRVHVLRDSVRAHDRAGITPGAGCRRPDLLDPTTAVCEDLRFDPPFYGDFTARLGPGDDSAVVEVSATQVTIEGGEGADALGGSENGDELSGGPGSDEIWGGDGFDRISGGPGIDTLVGGAGHDVLDYSDEARPVRVDLRVAGRAGPEGEPDRVPADFEGAIGGRGADVLVGDSESNSLEGGEGDDSIAGGAGGDGLNGGPGVDLVDGGDGPDRITDPDGGALFRGREGDDTFLIGGGRGRQPSLIQAGRGDDDVYGSSRPERIDLGPGKDVVFGNGGGDSIRARDGEPDHVECANNPVNRPAIRGSGVVRADVVDRTADCRKVLRDGPARLLLYEHLDPEVHHSVARMPAIRGFCPSDAGRRCRGTATLFADGRRSAARRFRVPHSSVGFIRAPLAPALRRRLAENGCVRIAWRIRTRDSSGTLRTLRLRYRLVYRRSAGAPVC